MFILICRLSDKPTEEKITEEQDTENVKTPKSEKKKKLSESRADGDGMKMLFPLNFTR